MKTCIIILAGLATVSLTLWLGGCVNSASGASTPPAGQECTVQFRRDALGAAANLPVPPMTGSINGAGTAVFGTLKSTAGDWIVLGQKGQELWIPKTVVLLIQMQGKQR